MSAQATRSLDFGAQTIRKIQFRLLPFMFLLYIVAVLDRVNIGFAALTMNKALAISAQQFGFLAGIFFIGYFFFEVPSNILLHKLGARVWIARILVSWGIVAACTGLVRTPMHLYIIRFLLGLAEAGFFPGMILYMTYWFRQRERAQAVAFFMTAQPISSILGAPLSGFILDHVHWLGIPGWRWLLVLEAAPAVVLGVVTYFVLPSRPEEATFLSSEEKSWLKQELQREEQKAEGTTGHVSALKALGSGRVWYLAVIYFTIIIGLYSMNFWLPQVVKGLSKLYSNTTIGLLVAIPHICGLIAMILISRHSDRTQERRFHAAIPAILGGIALLVVGRVTSPALSIALLAVMAIGIDSFFGPFWSLPGKFLTGFAAASGIALINSVGNLGGFVGPYVIGLGKDKLGSVYWGLAFVGISMLISAFLVIGIHEKPKAAQA
jgi:ACS family tartrate transporter-like MFS transporter